MNITKQEIILRENMEYVEVSLKQYFNDNVTGNFDIVTYIATYSDCIIVKSSRANMWAIVYAGECDSEIFNSIKKDSRVLDYSELYKKYGVNLNLISAYHTSRVTIEREPE